MKKVAILLTVFNRKDITVNCLRNLFIQKVPYGYSIKYFLTDDGSTDGTADAVRIEFPQVRIVNGDGSLYWGGGMNAAWSAALKDDEYDYFLWLNDDVSLRDGAIYDILLSSEEVGINSVVVGAFSEADGKTTSYGGRGKDLQLLNPNGAMQECEVLCGNMVLVPYRVYSLVGKLHKTLKHYGGDLYYSMVCKDKGIKLFMTKDYMGICHRWYPAILKWQNPEVPFIDRWKNYFSPLGYYPPAAFVIDSRRYGIFRACKTLLGSWVRMIFAIPYKK